MFATAALPSMAWVFGLFIVCFGCKGEVLPEENSRPECTPSSQSARMHFLKPYIQCWKFAACPTSASLREALMLPPGQNQYEPSNQAQRTQYWDLCLPPLRIGWEDSFPSTNTFKNEKKYSFQTLCVGVSDEEDKGIKTIFYYGNDIL